mgnify:CR=1 FL=1
MEENREVLAEATQEELNELLQIRRDKLTALREAGMDPFQQVRFDRTSNSQEILNNFEQMEGQEVSIAGRIMSKRDMGKASFSHIQDQQGKIQIYVKIDEVGAEQYEWFKKLDIGDIVGVKGIVFRTRRGEISVQVKEYTLLSKSLLPLPEKYHGLKDVDTRYRQRYVDLIVNPEVRDTFIKRSKAITAIRGYFDNLGYLEVDTPVLNAVQGGATARPFVTHHNALDIDLYLRIATELYLKRCIIGGFDRVYEIGRLFRNEGMDTTHNPEFTTIEFYEAYTDVNGMMERTEGLMKYVCEKVNGNMELPFGDVRVFVCCEYRDLDKEHEGSVHSYMKNNLFDGAGFNESNIFYPCLCSEDEDELKKYDDQISAAGGIDLMILGIGINGSIGFNEPATPFESYTHAQLLTDKTKKLVAEDFGGAENVPEKGVTMGIKTIVSAKYIDLIAAGEEKADAVHKIVYGKTIPFVPASMLQIHMNLNLYVDSAAASDI